MFCLDKGTLLFSDVYFLYIDIGLENKIKFFTVTISNYYNMTFSVFSTTKARH